MIPSESFPLGLHARNFVTGVQLSNQRHFRPPFRSQPLTVFALSFNESATCISYLGCHPEDCTALAGCAHCLCLNHAPHPLGTPKNFPLFPVVVPANSSFCALDTCVWVSPSEISSPSFSSSLICSVPIGNFPL